MKVDVKYNQFVGQSVTVTESTFEICGKTYPQQDTDETQSPLKELIAQATLDDLIVRVWLPTTIGTMEFRSNRINVYIKQLPDKTWAIDRLSIG